MSGMVPDPPRLPRLKTIYRAENGDRFAYWRDHVLIANRYSGAVKILSADGSVERLNTTPAETGQAIPNF